MACLRSTGHAPCLAERLAPNERRRCSRIDRILASRRGQERDYLDLSLTRPLPAGKLPHGQPTKEYTLCCSTIVRERRVMSDTTGEIAALSDKMGTAVRHRQRFSEKLRGGNVSYRRSSDAPFAGLEDGMWRAGAGKEDAGSGERAGA